MGVYIKSMEMPISCFGCSTKVDPDTRCCNIDGHLFEETFSRITSRRDEACPLVYVPPHGRLIDADALVKFINDLYYVTWDGGYAGGRKDACVAVLEKINSASTIIPAEEG